MRGVKDPVRYLHSTVFDRVDLKRSMKYGVLDPQELEDYRMIYWDLVVSEVKWLSAVKQPRLGVKSKSWARTQCSGGLQAFNTRC